MSLCPYYVNGYYKDLRFSFLIMVFIVFFVNNNPLQFLIDFKLLKKFLQISRNTGDFIWNKESDIYLCCNRKLYQLENILMTLFILVIASTFKILHFISWLTLKFHTLSSSTQANYMLAQIFYITLSRVRDSCSLRSLCSMI